MLGRNKDQDPDTDDYVAQLLNNRHNTDAEKGQQTNTRAGPWKHKCVWLLDYEDMQKIPGEELEQEELLKAQGSSQLFTK